MHSGGQPHSRLVSTRCCSAVSLEPTTHPCHDLEQLPPPPGPMMRRAQDVPFAPVSVRPSGMNVGHGTGYPMARAVERHSERSDGAATNRRPSWVDVGDAEGESEQPHTHSAKTKALTNPLLREPKIGQKSSREEFTADVEKACCAGLIRAPRAGLEPATLRLTAGCSAN
jgi:hypothetical protein